MNRFEELITAIQARPSVVIHVGAGTCKEYAFYKSLEPNRYIFVEPDQKLAEKARNRFKNANNISIIASAIAPRNGKRKLKITNNRRFSSLLSPGQLLDFYPNILVTDEVETEAIRLEQLCLNESIVRETDNLLVAELQGLEKDIFSSLVKKTLNKFKWIAIRSSEQTLYQHTSTKQHIDLPQAMRDAGYTVLIFKEDVPPFNNILCIRNDATLEQLNTISTLSEDLSNQKSEQRKLTHQLKQQLGKSQTQITALATENSEQLKQIKALEKAAQDKIVGLEKSRTQIVALTTQNSEQQQQIKELEKVTQDKITELEQSRTQITALTTENSEQLKQIKALEKTVQDEFVELEKSRTQSSTLTTENSVQLQQIKELEKATADKTTELEISQTQISTLTTNKNEQLKRITELAQAVEENSEEMAEIQKDLRIKNKIILKSDTDLRDLQSQYRSALQHQDQQHALLCELKEKLELAAEFYKKLNLQDQILEGSTSGRKTAETLDLPKTDNNND